MHGTMKDKTEENDEEENRWTTSVLLTVLNCCLEDEKDAKDTMSTLRVRNDGGGVAKHGVGNP